ncbi:13443_t:CDS:1 [Acaulospora morrowiae]|uniref:tRNA (adenine(58)-N(1))-methyltransferase catalytic subunit TRM61 n=1 Tax=Acaulospora morrowiae TaxID=94023 RepID=A0A9N9DDC7_9GLOM|nr:13443_t:CDS:1 [Acaulospora morrowiae]
MEAGTGNASLTLHLARSLYPTGQLHSIDIDPVASTKAKATVTNFSRGLYSDVVKFSTGMCSEVISDDPHLYDGIVLDIPEPSGELHAVVSKLKVDRFIVCYLPNMNQVLTLFQYIRAQKLPLELEKVLEVQWRPWDVKATVIRSRMGSEPFSVKELINRDEIPDEAIGYICRPSHEPTAHTAFLMRFEKTDRNQIQETVVEKEIKD